MSEDFGKADRSRVRGVVILSPHSDDAALSVPCTIALSQELGLGIKVLTCFSRSRWAPHLQGVADVERVSQVRTEEDCAFARQAGNLVRTIPLGLDEFPVRRPASWPPIGPQEPEPDLVAALTRAIVPHLEESYLLAPLGLGHPDHCIVAAAAFGLVHGGPFAFYEDVPYRLSLNEEQIQARVAEVGRALSVPLFPTLVTRADRSDLWYGGVSCYPSQFSPSERQSIGEQVMRMPGERLWTT
jgi:LmbE family N-acetylglucosaminyl deacetylase